MKSNGKAGKDLKNVKIIVKKLEKDGYISHLAEIWGHFCYQKLNSLHGKAGVIQKMKLRDMIPYSLGFIILYTGVFICKNFKSI